VIAVSHDRYFMKRIATRVVTVEDGRLVDYEGDYEVRGVHLSLELGSQG
jgi:ATPase subunit of ABC transporter with duplicated ATPase domains